MRSVRFAGRSISRSVSRMRRLFLEQLEERSLLAAILTVNTAADSNSRDDFLTVREAILVSNRTLAVATLTAAEQAQVSGTPTNADTDTIAFNIPGAGVQSISTATALPALTDPVVIDGYTQPGASANTLAVGSDAVLLVEIFSTTNQNGLVLNGGNSTVRGLVLNRFNEAVSVASNNNVIEGNFIGIGPDGVTDRGNQFSGVRLTAGANNLIGGITPAARNVLAGRGFFSGNFVAQIAIGKTSTAAASVVNTTIRGNYIGTNAAGTAAVVPSNGFRVAGVSLGDGVNTTIGGGDVDDGLLDGVVHARNVISGNGNGIYAAAFNSGYLLDGLTIQGNFVGTDSAGTSIVPNIGTGVFVGEAARSTTLQLGGTAPGAGNVISGNRGSGVLGGALSMTAQGNFVGTDLSGTLDLGNGIDGSAGQGSGGEGIHISLGGNEGPNFQILIGGTTPAARNVISGNAANGVLVTGVTSGSVTVQGNYIGTRADGQTPLPNLLSGIEMNRGAKIGGVIAGEQNVIAFNAGRGVSTTLGSTLYTAPILGNSIHSNGNLGIDLINVFSNDLGDVDTGINSGQNFPVLTGVNAVGDDTVISGRLNSNANSTYRIEFFYNDVRDPSGFGEGQTFLGFTDVTTDGSGNVSFVSPVVPGIIPAGRFVTATATKTSTSETSEFSFALASLIVTNTLDSGIGSLREAITVANTFVNFDRDGVAGNDIDPITFAIPAAGVQTITPLSALPTISEAVSIDGYTQPGASPNTLVVGSNAAMLIELNGVSAGSSANGLTLSGAGNSTVRGLVVNRFGGSGVVFESSNNVVEGSYFGIDAGGMIERSNLFAGVRVNQGTNNRIGGTTTQARNVLAGNGSTTGTAQIVVGFGVGTVIRGNYIGVNAAGNAAVHPTASGNDDGVFVVRGTATIIGGNDADDGLVDGVVRAGNVISGNLMGIRINATGSDPNSVNGITIQGNTIGLDATGTVDVGNFGDGISAVAAAFTGGNVQIGGTQLGAGNIISANDGRGFVGSAANLVIEGNRIGTDVSGTLNFGNGGQGVQIALFGESGLSYQVRVGGATAAARNIISGNSANGILATEFTAGSPGSVVIQGNYIGTQADGQSPLPNLLDGVQLQLQRNSSIGGTAAGAGNVIAFNRQRGVNLSGFNTPILSNSIFSNGAAGNTLSHLGIDLAGNGVTPNDAGDGDFGANRLQNFPVFSSAALAAGALTIQYSVPTSTSNATYPLRIEFFKADADGQEGQTFLGFDTYTSAEAQTVKTFVLTPAITLTANDKLVATATDSNGNTSEFSVSQVLTTANQPPTVNAGPDAVINNFSAFTRTGSFADPDANTWTGTVNYGDGSGDLPLTLNADKTFALNRSYANEGTFTVTVTINDGAGGIASDTAVVTVNRFTVDTTADNTLTDGLLTLREAITNANLNADLNTIRFNFSATDPRHVYYSDDGRAGEVSRVNLSTNVENLIPTATTDDALIPTSGPLAIDPDWTHSWYSIQVASALPAITEAVTINGFSQAGAITNSNPVGLPENSVLRIELTAPTGNEFDGLSIAANDSTVRGLSILGFGFFQQRDGVEITGSGNTIAGCHVGADVSGLTGFHKGSGIFVHAADNVVGGTSTVDRNLIAFNQSGVQISGDTATGNRVVGSEFYHNHPSGTGASVVIFGGASQNTIGGDAPGSGNAIHVNVNGVWIYGTGTENNRVQGNSVSENVRGILVQSNGNLVGGLSDVPGTAAGNVISRNDFGITIDGAGTEVQGNLLGTDATGTAALENSVFGILDRGIDTVIGGPDPRARNIVSASLLDGISLQGSGAIVQNNFVGTDITGTADLGNLRSGISVSGVNNSIVGNVIAFTLGEFEENGDPHGGGVIVVGGAGNTVSANSIFSNQGLGIELDAFVSNQLPMPNDLDDNDVGPNNLQNYPIITSVTTGGTTQIIGTLNSTANGTFRVEFFSSTAADPSGFGEAQTYLGFTTVTTDGAGNGSFSFSTAAPVPAGQFITSTATDSAGNTSEFSGLVVNQVPITFSINDVTLSEGASGNTAFSFSVTLSANPSSPVTVTVNTADGTTNPATTADNDYAAIANQVLTFAPNGPLTQNVTVNVVGDSKFERNETFLVNLSSPIGATLADGQGLGTILNDDLAPTLSFSANNSVQEGNLTADDRKVSFTLNLSAVSGVDVAGTVSTASGTAIEGTDFVSADGVPFFIPAGQTRATYFVSVIEDLNFEPDEQFTIIAAVMDQSSVINMAGSASGTGTIQNDDLCSLIVTNTNNSGPGSLRAAIECANAMPNIDRDGLPGVDPDPITFAIPASDPRHVYYSDDGRAGQVSRVNLSTNVENLLTTSTTDDALIPTSGPLAIDPDWTHSWYSIQVASALPEIREAVTINGLTQIDAIASSNPVVGAYNSDFSGLERNENSVLRIELTIAAAASANGLTITSSGSTIRGLVIQGFGRSADDNGAGFPDSSSDAVEITSTGNSVVGSHLGADVSGLTGLGNGHAGVFLNGAADNIVGGSAPADRVLAMRNPYGVVINGVAATGNSILGSVLGPDNFQAGVLLDGGASQNAVGGGIAGAGNVLVTNGAGVRFSGTGTSDNSVLGNFISIFNTYGIQIDPGNDNNQIGGLTDTPGTGAGNVISGNIIGLEIMAAGTTIQGNLIGVYPTGQIGFSNLNTTLRIQGDNSLIGGSDVRARNVISGENQDHGGIQLFGNGTVVQNNFIGTDITGAIDQGNQGGGILMVGSDNRIEANVIAFNRLASGELPPPGSGITILDGTGNVITANSIYSNDGLGIQLSSNFGANPTPLMNDLGDSDGGPNNGQNYPVITSVTTGGTTQINGTLNSIANGTFRVEFFSSTAVDPSGFGEGQTYLGFTTVTTDGAGNGSFSFSTAAPVPTGQSITSTATDSAGNTSEFSGLVVNQVPITFSINDVTLSEGASGNTAFSFSVTLSANPSSPVTVTVNTADGTTNPATTADNDYAAIANQVLTFAPNGPLMQTVTVNVNGDGKFERTENFFVNLSNPMGATLADGQGLGTILNDDLAPTLSFSANNSVQEGNLTADDRKVPFALNLSAVSGVDVAGTVSTASGTAIEGTDFVSADGVPFFIPAGQTRAMFFVSVIEDLNFEPDEQFTLSALATDPSTVSNAAGEASGVGTILNDDVLPLTLSINDVSKSEGNSGTTAFTFTITLSRNPTSTVRVTANTANGTTNPATTSDNDYTAITNQVLTFAPNGPLTKTVTVNVKGDAKFERNETFFVNLSNPTGATLLDNQGLGTILNDDLAPLVTFSAANSVNEGNVTADDRKVPFKLTLSAVSGVEVAGVLSTTGGTATEGTDFVSADGVAFIIPAGQTQATIFVSVMEDTVVEPNEQFTLSAVATDPSTVRNAGGAVSGVGTIVNDDVAPLTLSINDVSKSEGNSGTTAFTFTVTLSRNPSATVRVTANTANGTTNPATTADNDYTAITNQALTFAPNGPLTKTVTVNVKGDAKFERNETFFVNLTNPTGATLLDSQGLGTILNDDLAPTVAFSANNAVLEGNVTADDRKVPFTLTLSAVSGVDVAGLLSTTGGTATEGTDFESADGVAFLIPAGQTQAVVFVCVIEDTDIEPNEQFTLFALATDPSTVSNAGGASSGMGTIADDDANPTGQAYLVIGADAAANGKPAVSVYDDRGVRLAKFYAYETTYRGGVRVVLADVTGDGVPEIVTAPGRSHRPEIKVFRLADVLSGNLYPTPQFQFLAYAANFTGGVSIAVGDLLGDGLNDIVATPSREGSSVNGLWTGGAEVRVFENRLVANAAIPFSTTPDRKFLAFAANTIGGAQFIGGATVATGDIQPGGKQEVIVGSGSGMRATIRAFNVTTTTPTLIQQYLPFEASFRGGVFVTAASLNDDNVDDIVAAAGQGGGSLVEVRNGQTGGLLQSLVPYQGNQQQTSPQSAVRVVAKGNQILLGQGPDGKTQKVRRFSLNSQAVDFLFENDPDFAGGFNLG